MLSIEATDITNDGYGIYNDYDEAHCFADNIIHENGEETIRLHL